MCSFFCEKNFGKFSQIFSFFFVQKISKKKKKKKKKKRSKKKEQKNTTTRTTTPPPPLLLWISFVSIREREREYSSKRSAFFFCPLCVCARVETTTRTRKTTTFSSIPRDNAVVLEHYSKRERAREREFLFGIFQKQFSGVDILIGKSKRCACV